MQFWLRMPKLCLSKCTKCMQCTRGMALELENSSMHAQSKYQDTGVVNTREHFTALIIVFAHARGVRFTYQWNPCWFKGTSRPFESIWVVSLNTQMLVPGCLPTHATNTFTWQDDDFRYSCPRRKIYWLQRVSLILEFCSIVMWDCRAARTNVRMVCASSFVMKHSLY